MSALETLLASAPRYPRRVVCLTEETTETLYRIGCEDLIVGVSGFTVRPPAARKKPKVSSFLDANYERILELEPDVVLGFSDLQATLGAELAKRGVPVVIFNQRSIAEILQTIRVIGAIVGHPDRSAALADELEQNVRSVAAKAALLPRKPKVFFEEWHEPLISCIRWCSELIELCGGIDVCAETRDQQGAKGRIYEPEEVARREPEAVIASWCGRKAKREKIASRPGWADVPAVRNDQLYEIKSAYVLQPGPAALTDGLAQIARIVEAVAHGETLPAPAARRLAFSRSRAVVPNPLNECREGFRFPFSSRAASTSVFSVAKLWLLICSLRLANEEFRRRQMVGKAA